MGLKIRQLQLNLPFGIGGVTVQVTQAQQNAAWALYVEYATRIATQELKPGEGSVREALDSIHALFKVTRDTLKKEGHGAAEGPDSVGPFAIHILNDAVRPFVVNWHSSFSAFENQQKMEQQATIGAEMTPVIDDLKWGLYVEFYTALNELRIDLSKYVDGLGEIAGVKKETSQ